MYAYIRARRLNPAHLTREETRACTRTSPNSLIHVRPPTGIQAYPNEQPQQKSGLGVILGFKQISDLRFKIIL